MAHLEVAAVVNVTAKTTVSAEIHHVGRQLSSLRRWPVLKHYGLAQKSLFRPVGRANGRGDREKQRADE
jgi:hypothetical protein